MKETKYERHWRKRERLLGEKGQINEQIFEVYKAKGDAIIAVENLNRMLTSDCIWCKIQGP